MTALTRSYKSFPTFARENRCALFALTAILSGITGALATSLLCDIMVLKDPAQIVWFASAVGGNLGPLLIDLARRVIWPLP